MTVSKVTIPDYSFKCNIWEFSVFSTSLPILTFLIILTLMSMRQYHITVLIYISQWLIILNLFHVFNDHIFIYIFIIFGKFSDIISPSIFPVPFSFSCCCSYYVYIGVPYFSDSHYFCLFSNMIYLMKHCNPTFIYLSIVSFISSNIFIIVVLHVCLLYLTSKPSHR